MKNNVLELTNLEIFEFCLLSFETGEKKYSKSQLYPGVFTGFYFRDESTFFASYPTPEGPFIYYKGKQYPISKDLTIVLKKSGKDRTFKVLEYGIEIRYKESPYIDFDNWSTERDVDLFFRICEDYKTDDYYVRYTKDFT